jgi:MarR family transcriptional regulator, organic hydroperoxide resistance regulator
LSDFDLQSFLPYLVNRAGVRLSDDFSVDLRRFDLSIGMWRVLAALWHDGAVRLCELAASTSIEVSTLSRQITGMQRRHLVTRTRATDDARAVEVDLTPQGRAITAQLIPLAVAYEQAALEGFSVEDATLLRRLLTQLYGNLTEIDAHPGAVAKARSAAR